MSGLFEKAIGAFDKYNSKDPNLEEIDGRKVPKELLYAQRMSIRLIEYHSEATEALRLAVRCQHIGRWEIPRDSYPMDRKGYLQWRNKLKIHHSEIAGKILTQLGYDKEITQRVQFLVQKKQLKHDDESQMLEDVVCLVFLEHYFDDFIKQHDHEKVISIVDKTWMKMSEHGQSAALRLQLSPKAKAVITEALNI